MSSRTKVVKDKLLAGISRALALPADSRFIAAAVVSFSVLLSLLIRLAPLRWGVYLNEFDPYYEYYLAETILQKGDGDLLRGLAWWFSWWFDRSERDTLFWAPGGRDTRASSQLGAPLFSAMTYTLLRSLGFDLDLYTIHAFIPAVGAAFTSLFAYFLARELWDSSAGVLSSLFMSCCWPFIYRTNLGAKHEGLAIPLMLASFTFFIQALRSGSVMRGIVSGILMSLVVFSWGGFLYPWNLLALTVLIWLLINPSDTRTAKVYIPYFILSSIAIALLPRFGPRIAYASPAAIVPLLTLGVSLLTLTHILPTLGRTRSVNRKTIVIVVTCIGAIFLSAWWTGVLASLPGRIIAVIMPILREVGVTTVAEHAVPTWASIYGDYSLLIPLSAFGALLSGYRMRKRFEDLFTVLFWSSAAYAAASMARLTLLLGPAVALLTASAFSELTGKLAVARITSIKARKRAGISDELVALIIILVSASLLVPLLNYTALTATHQPALILSSSIPVVDYDYQYTDWVSALEWIKANVPAGSVIATWWDYGYWISVNTLRNTTCDNATIDTNQIQKIAKAFLSPEEEALRIFERLNVTYVVVFEPFLPATLPNLGITVYYSPAGSAYGGDLAKSYQMARWIGADTEKYLGFGYVDSYPIIVPKDTDEARNATLYRLLFSRATGRYFYIFDQQLSYWISYQGPRPTIPEPEHFELVYASSPNRWVLVYKVIYPELKTP